MNFLRKAMVSNHKMIKNYRTCRDKAENLGKIFVIKHNQPDAVLLSLCEYERLAVFIEYIESLQDEDFAKIVKSLPKEGIKKNYSIARFVR